MAAAMTKSMLDLGGIEQAVAGGKRGREPEVEMEEEELEEDDIENDMLALDEITDETVHVEAVKTYPIHLTKPETFSGWKIEEQFYDQCDKYWARIMLLEPSYFYFFVDTESTEADFAITGFKLSFRGQKTCPMLPLYPSRFYLHQEGLMPLHRAIACVFDHGNHQLQQRRRRSVLRPAICVCQIISNQFN